MSSNKSESKPKTWQLVQDIKNMELEIDARKQIERVLRSREDRFKTIFNHAPIAYFLIDLNGNFVDGNFTSFELTGYTKEELFGKTFIEVNLIAKKDWKAVTELINRSARGECTGPDEFSMIKNDGSIRIIEISTSPVTVTNERLVLGIAHDITDRKLSQEKLQESEERFRKLFDSAKDAFMTLNPPTWKFTSGNPAILEMFKVKSIEEFLTYGPWDISPEKQPDGRLSSEKAKEMIETAMTKGSNFFEWTHKRINGESFPATVLLTKIQLKDETFLQATVRDITDSKQVEKALRKSEQRFKQVAESAGDWIWEVDAKGMYTYSSPVIEKILGYRPEEVVGKKHFYDFFRSDEKKELKKGALNVFKMKESFTGFINTNIHKDGHEVILETNGVPILGKEGRLLGYRGADMDVTERKQAEEALKESEERFRKLFDSAKDALMTLNPPTWKFTSGNPAILEMFKVKSVKEFLTYGPWDISPEKQPDGRLSSEKAKEMIEIAMTKGSNYFEWTHKRLSGESFPATVLLTKIQLKDETFLQATVRDITERKQADDTLKKSESLLKSILNSTGDGLLVVNANGQVTHRNTEFIKMWNIPSKLSNDTDDSKLINFVLSQLSEPSQFVAKVKELYNSTKTSNDILHFKDGRIFERNSQPLMEENTIAGRVWNFRDITKRKQAELELRQSEERFKRLFNDLGDAVYVTKLGGANRGRILEVNHAAVRQTGYTRNELLKMNVIKDLYISGSGENKAKDWEEKLSQGEIFTTTEKKIRKDGIEFWTEVIVTSIRYRGEIASLSINHDITHRKQAEELKDSIYMISEAAHSAENLEDLFKLIHQVIGKLVNAKNFYIALYDAGNKMLNFPYFVDEYDEIPAPQKLGNGLTEYVLRTGKLLLASPKVFEKLVKKGEVESHGAPSIDWLGVPLKTKDTTIGVLVIQSYTEGVRYNEETKEILMFVSNQVAMAIERKQMEKSLRESEKKYRDLFEKSEDAVLIIHNGKFVDCNQSAVNMLRYNNKSELLNTHPSELSPEKQPDGKMSFTKANDIMKIALKNGSYRFEWDHKKSDGEVFPVEVLLTAISTDEKNQILHTVWRDISERKQAEEEIEQKTKELEKQFKISEKQRIATLATLSDLNRTTKELKFEINERKKSEKALKENEEKYHSLTENIPIGIYRNTPGAKGKFIEVNKALVDMFGFKNREAMLAASVSSLYVTPGERKKFSDKVFAKGFVKNEELRLFRRDGRSFIGSSTASAVKDEDGKVIHYDGIIEDITERQELRTQLQESEEKFRSIVNNSPDIILRIDLHGVITFINYEYSNQKPEDIIGKTIYELMPTEFHEKARSTIKKVFKTGESFSFENLGISADDSVLWYRNNVAPLNKNGKVIAATIIVTDISEQKQIEIMKNEFVGSVSHELQTPLTIIRESLSILSDGLVGELNKEQLDIVNPCMEDVDRLSRIINNLLDISRIEGQNIILEREMVDIVKLVQGVISSFENKAALKNIELVFTPSRKSINLYLDKDRIIQVFMNLIGNSMKFTAKGKIEVFITKKANEIECCIADTGRGIEQKDIGTLFDRFHQVGKVMRAGEKGSGLGLSISKGIIQLHSGRIWVDSKINKGSKFCFSLPMYSIDEIIIENIENEIKKVADKHIPLSLLLIKLKNFSNIDSKFGVDKANRVTKLILQIIQDTLAPGEFSFTKRKDEVILFSDITKQNITVLFSKLEDILAESVLKIDQNLKVDLFHGYSLYPDDGDNASKLLQNAKKVLLKKDKD